MIGGGVPCYVFFRNERGLWQDNTAAHSLFEGAMNAIREFHERGRVRPGMDTVLRVIAGWAHEEKEYFVRASRVVEHFGLNPSEWLDE